MVVTALDTYALVKHLTSVGFSDEQAAALTSALRQAQDIDLSNLTTKADLVAVKTDLAALSDATKADVAAVRADLAALAAATKADIAALAVATKTDLAETKTEILKWMFGSMGVQTIVIIGALVSLTRMAGH
jgi:hypothetical protein